MVSSARGLARLSSLQHRHRHVVGRLHLCGDGHATAFVPRRFGNRRNLQDLPVSFWAVKNTSSMLIPFRAVSIRVLGTPNDEIWPGVSTLPDYKPSFPKWNAVDLERAVPTLDAQGIDLLAVSTAAYCFREPTTKTVLSFLANLGIRSRSSYLG